MLKEHAKMIYEGAIKDSLPDSAVENALKSLPEYSGRLILVAIGKAGYQMARAAYATLGDKINSGIVITKYGHSSKDFGSIRCFEASHPVPDENAVLATRRALKLTEDLSENDLVLFLISGGGSALFEDVDCTLSELQELTGKLLACGAHIEEINAVRKHISNVKGGRFAQHCAPAKIFGIALSDVLGNRLDTIASGPACADMSTSTQVQEIFEKYGIKPSEKISELVKRETPKSVTNATHLITGSASELCRSAKRIATELGYEAEICADDVTCQARELGQHLAELAIKHKDTKKPLAFIFGGETVVRLNGNGLGGRNQETVLSAAIHIKEMTNCVIASVGSDGTDGPTDAAGGICDCTTYAKIAKSGKSALEYLNNNDSYTALSYSNDLVITGPTGTNVNDLAFVLIQPK